MVTQQFFKYVLHIGSDLSVVLIQKLFASIFKLQKQKWFLVIYGGKVWKNSYNAVDEV
jgi:hypothetical protein